MTNKNVIKYYNSNIDEIVTIRSRKEGWVLTISDQ